MGLVASCTMGEEEAAEACARKVQAFLGCPGYELKRVGKANVTWIFTAEEKPVRRCRVCGCSDLCSACEGDEV